MIKHVFFIVAAVALLLALPIDAEIRETFREGLLFVKRLLRGSYDRRTEDSPDREPPGGNQTEYEYEYETSNGTEYEYEYESQGGAMIGADGSSPPSSITWTLQSYNPLQVRRGDQVVFIANDLHGLTMPDATGFQNCQLPVSNLVDPTFGFTFVFDTSTVAPGQSVYFFCPVDDHCNSFGMKLNVTVL